MWKITELFSKRGFLEFTKRFSLFCLVLIIEVFIVSEMVYVYELSWTVKIGKVHVLLTLLFSCVLFLMVAHKKLKKIRKPDNLDLRRISFFGAGNLLICILFVVYSRFLEFNPWFAERFSFVSIILWLILGIVIVGTLFFAFFDKRYTAEFVSRFRHELYSSFLMSLIIGLFLKSIIMKWQFTRIAWNFLSFVVAKIVYLMLSIFFNGAYYRIDDSLSPVVGIADVSAKIYWSCSGMEGISMFVVVFALLLFIEKDRVRSWKDISFLAPIGIIGMFFLNILRVFFIFVAGHFTSQEFATGIFHSNAGWILFTIYCLFFIDVMYRFNYIDITKDSLKDK
jgi:exosortase/archaeosortase family protein